MATKVKDPGKEPNRSKLDTVNVSIGNISRLAGSQTTKTEGAVTRGNGAAVRGVTARGPMA
jgi:hypothetical protein